MTFLLPCCSRYSPTPTLTSASANPTLSHFNRGCPCEAHHLTIAMWQHAGWGYAAQQRIRLLYDTLSAGAASPSHAATIALLVELGVPHQQAYRYVHAIARSAVDGQVSNPHHAIYRIASPAPPRLTSGHVLHATPPALHPTLANTTNIAPSMCRPGPSSGSP